MANKSVWVLSKQLRKLIGKNKAVLTKYATKVPAMQATVTTCNTLVRANKLRAAYLALPNKTPIEHYWRMQCLDALAVRIRKLNAMEPAAPKAAKAKRKRSVKKTKTNSRKAA